MKYIRWIGIALLILIIGYLSGIGLFADSSSTEFITLILICIAGAAGVGFLLPNQWQLAALCSWGALAVVLLELSTILRRGSVPGQQPMLRLVLIGVIALGLALLGGYIGSFISRQISRKSRF